MADGIGGQGCLFLSPNIDASPSPPGGVGGGGGRGEGGAEGLRLAVGDRAGRCV